MVELKTRGWFQTIRNMASNVLHGLQCLHAHPQGASECLALMQSCWVQDAVLVHYLSALGQVPLA